MERLGSDLEIVSLVRDDQPTGYLSNVYTATVKQSDEELHLFIKAAHEDKQRAEFVTDSGMDKIELSFYRDILPSLIKFEEEKTGQSVLTTMFPKFYAGDTGDFYLILENVCHRGFKLEDCNKGLNEDQADLMVKQVSNND